MPVLAGRLVLMPIIGRFLATFPKVRLDLSLCARIVEEGFDFAVRMGTIDDSDLLSRKLARIERRLVASPVCISGVRGT
jgi:DNA-binding transcriptional LysR family regulator